jgi:hypothetical protein
MKERNDEHRELMVGAPKIRIGPSREAAGRYRNGARQKTDSCQ